MNSKSLINKFRTLVKSEEKSDNEVKHLSQMIMYRFLSEVERITDERNISRKDLAKRINVSPSYITQLYQGTKKLNIETLGRLEKALDMRFEIKTVETNMIEIGNGADDCWDEKHINILMEKFTRPNSIFYKVMNKPQVPNYNDMEYELSADNYKHKTA